MQKSNFDYVLVIPARFASTRLPGKPLAIINGISMIARVYNICCSVVDSKLVYVATDDVRIMEHCAINGINCIMTSDKCLTGTDRIAEVAKIISADYYINIQGDEPLFNPEDIKLLLKYAVENKGDIINGYCRIDDE